MAPICQNCNTSIMYGVPHHQMDASLIDKLPMTKLTVFTFTGATCIQDLQTKSSL